MTRTADGYLVSSVPGHEQMENTDFSRTFWETTWSRFEPDGGFRGDRLRQSRLDQFRYDEMASQFEWDRQRSKLEPFQLQWLNQNMRGTLSSLVYLVRYRDYVRLRQGNPL